MYSILQRFSALLRAAADSASQPASQRQRAQNECSSETARTLTRGYALMESERYNGYKVWGHAILQQEDILMQERYAASGTIFQNGKLVEASGVLGHFDTEGDAQRAGLAWARAWIDIHG